MEKGTTIFYHKHIQSSIARLEERKDKFIHFRLQFLKEFCEPIEEKIRTIFKEIEKYKMMRDTQQQVIETEPQISGLKQEISSYLHTQQYFKDKVDQYEKKSLQFDQYNKDLQKQIQHIKIGIKTQNQKSGFQLPQVARKRLKTIQDEAENKSFQSRSFALPSIKHAQGHEQNQSVLIQSKGSARPTKIINIGQKIQRSNLDNSRNRLLANSRQQIVEEVTSEQKQLNLQRRKQVQMLRQRITKFNKTQTLFQQCFQVKKNSVQKSVSQLQSKLIVNREQFLSTCQAIGSRQTKVSFEEFSKLTSDEILTLFISFVWLNKKIKGEFAVKRKAIMDYIGKLPKLQTY